MESKVKFYNTLTKKEGLLEESDVGFYVCGPTVYDDPHIGHVKSAYVFDMIVRYLRYRGYKVTFVRNVTDIDDKIINKANEELKSEQPGKEISQGAISKKTKEVAERYLARYRDSMSAFSIASPDAEPKATETIREMILFIKELIKLEFAYEVSGNVYFAVRKFVEYGKLSGQSIDEMEEGVRVSLDNNKRDPLDFALWKASKKNEPSWKSPWGHGRPGWHIECSVMSTKHLGERFIIHGGGLDLMFPHHENEIAQTVCAGKTSAKYWIHNGLLTINGHKMSKSLGNFITVEDFMLRYKDPDLLKLLFLHSHYRHPVDYTEEKIVEMKRSKDRIKIFLDRCDSIKQEDSRTKTVLNQEISDLKKEFIYSMDNDFNSCEALSVIFKLVGLGNKYIDEGIHSVVFEVGSVIRELCILFGLEFKKEELEDEFEEEIISMIRDRDNARKNKDFEKADVIRNALLEKGIILEDAKGGTKWRRQS